MDKEKILLDALNTFGNFTSVEQEFNYNQLEVIYEAMDKVLHIAPVVGRSEQCNHKFERVEKGGEFQGNQCDCGEWEDLT